MDSKDQIKQALNIVDVVSEYVKLQRTNTNYKGLCPFHNEKTPSFNVSEDKQIFYCFGCHEGGDMFSFIQKIENMDFREALELLAQKAGIRLERYDGKKAEKVDSIKEALDLGQRFYHKILRTSHGAEALAYLKQRGLEDMTIDTWGLGYAPDAWDTLVKALYSKGVTDAAMVGSGLVIRNEKGKIYDRFRGRITFPINNASGSVVGFTSRILPSKDDGKQGKYVNTPQTEVYNKSEVLFGLDKAKKSIKQEGFVVIVEGNMDVIMSFQAGVTNIVAASGTALTTQQVAQLQRYTDTVYFAFDQDAAGKRAALRGLDIVLSQGMNVFVIDIFSVTQDSQMKDAADVVAKSPSLWKKAVTSALPMMEYYIRLLLDEYDLGSAQGKARFAQSFKEQVARLVNPVERNHWISVASQRCALAPELLTPDAPQHKHRAVQVIVRQSDETSKTESREDISVQALYSIALSVPRVAGYLSHTLSIEDISSKTFQDLFKKLFLYYNNNDLFNYGAYTSSLEEFPELHVAHVRSSLVYEKDFSDLASDALDKEVQELIAQMKKGAHRYAITKLQQKLAEAEHQGDAQEVASIMKKIAQHTKELNS